MPEFLPFAGIRYDAGRLAGSAGPAADLRSVAAPPYDVIDEDERAQLEAADPHNAVRLLLPRDATDCDRYRVAADAFSAWQAAGVLVADPEPRFYLYRMDFDDEDGRPRHTRGVIGALGLPTADPAGTATVMPHERTHPKAKSDRLALLRATRANLDPIWCLSLAPGLTQLLDADAEPLARCVDTGGVRHELRALPGALDGVSAAIGGAPLLIADGHHRFETACTYSDEVARTGIADPGAGRIMAFVVELSDDELCVRAIHRVLSGIGHADLRTSLAAAFEVRDAGPSTSDGVTTLRHRMVRDGGLGLVDRSGLALLVPRPGALGPALAGVDAPLRAVDATLFEVGVQPQLGATAEVAYRDDAAVAAALVEKGAADAAVLLRPVTVPQIREAAFAGVRMPPKTTFFHPKPRTGMVFRSLDR
ncbi:MAG TPA: DUF1015 domain-containing protein [Acidimicrobiia bacterium]